MAKIKAVEYFRVKPRWLMVKITDENGEYGWGEATLEGHDLAVEGALDEMVPRIIGLEAKYAPSPSPPFPKLHSHQETRLDANRRVRPG